MEIDWTYLRERQNQHYLPNPSMDTTREEEKVRIKTNMEKRKRNGRERT